jgi:hypothetical protein
LPKAACQSKAQDEDEEEQLGKKQLEEAEQIQPRNKKGGPPSEGEDGSGSAGTV